MIDYLLALDTRVVCSYTTYQAIDSRRHIIHDRVIFGTDPKKLLYKLDRFGLRCGFPTTTITRKNVESGF